MNYELKDVDVSFKPCYKWNTFNTRNENVKRIKPQSFKPCYKWNTFNTVVGASVLMAIGVAVLNLVINGIPSIQ